jgi:antitoxin component HigA of HigAB toxin-antitoxin module
VGLSICRPSAEDGSVTAKLDRLAALLAGHSPDRLEAFWSDVMADPSSLSATIAAIIKARGITSYALSKASGVHGSVIQRFVNGERGLTLETAEKLVQALGLILVEKKPPKKKK